ncbi:MAG: RluA family pseudouridine synthase [Patescibacteria group bacterium]|nr:RluA family pseudouridine synthase [Patescibacteria group bacterium]
MNKKVIQKNIARQSSKKKKADVFLVEKFQMTRSQAQKKIKSELVFVNNKPVESKTLIAVNDEVVIRDKKKNTPRKPLEIIFEDKHLIVIDKPTGLSSHPAPGENEPTISEILAERLYISDDKDFPGIVHRLDKGTSGIMILAKTAETKKDLQDQFKKRKITKKYLALIEGKIKPEKGIIDLPIKREKNNREKMGINVEGRSAKTKYIVKKKFAKYSLLELIPETGRTHQIRVHLSAIGFPIVGDVRYGKKSDFVDRIFLHATKISFIHPKTKKQLTFESPLPKTLAKALSNLDSIEEEARN